MGSSGSGEGLSAHKGLVKRRQFRKEYTVSSHRIEDDLMNCHVKAKLFIVDTYEQRA